ncbi:MAG: 3-hydroxyacyl-CoA dehydrogenase family protein [Clostridiaceae bacterium]
MELLKKVNKHPIRANKDVLGFVENRLQHALWREAISIIENGIADAATVDEAIKFGFGIRLPDFIKVYKILKVLILKLNNINTFN